MHIGVEHPAQLPGGAERARCRLTRNAAYSLLGSTGMRLSKGTALTTRMRPWFGPPALTS